MHKNTSTTTAQHKPLRPFASLSFRGYRWYWIGAIIGPGAVLMEGVARGWLIYQMTDSAFLLGVVTACLGIPYIFIVPFAGVIADRIDKRNMIMFSESIIMASSFVMTILLYLHLIQVWHVIVTTLGLGIGMAFSMPSRQAIISELLDREHLMNGIALYSMGSNSMRILGPVAAGLLASFAGVESVFLAATLLYILVLFSIFMIGPREVKERAQKTNPFEDLVEGVKYIAGHRTVMVLIICAYVIAFMGTNYMTLLPVFVRDIFRLGPEGLGFLTGATALGALFSAVIVATMGSLKRKGIVLLAGCFVYGLALLAFANSPIYNVALLILLITGGTNALCLMMNQTILQTNVDQHVLGRVLSLYLIASGLQNLAGLPFGAVAQQIGAPLTITLCGSILAVFAVVVMIMAPRIRNL